jgi:ankyrin repeat protein
VNSSSFPQLDISQKALNAKIQEFIGYLSLSIPGWPIEGLCHGYSVLMLRADILGERAKHLKRLHQLAASTSSKLKWMASIWMGYQAEFAKKAAEYRHKLELQLFFCRGDKKKEKDVRKKIFELVSADVLAKFNPISKMMFAETYDLYVFIHSLLSAHRPDIDLSQFAEKNMQDDIQNFAPRISQHHLIHVLERLPTDMPLAHSGAMNFHGEKSIFAATKRIRYIANSKKKLHTLGFVFTRQELIHSLDDIIFEGDYAVVTGFNHDFYLSKQKGEFVLLDSNRQQGLDVVPVGSNAINKIAAAAVTNKIIEYLYTGHGYPAENLAVGFLIVPTKNHERPSPDAIIQKILVNRGNNRNVNATSKFNVTALWMAAYVDCDAVVKLLLENNADKMIADECIDAPAYYEPACRGYLKTSMVFMFFNADFMHINKEKTSPYANAKSWYQHAMLEMITHHHQLMRVFDTLLTDVELGELKQLWFSKVPPIPGTPVKFRRATYQQAVLIVLAIKHQDYVSLGSMIVKNNGEQRSIALYLVARLCLEDYKLIQFLCEHEANETAIPQHAAILILMLGIAAEPLMLRNFLIEQYSQKFNQMQLGVLLKFLVDNSSYICAGELLARHPDAYVNACDQADGMRSMLHKAVLGNQFEFVKLLCLRHANVTMEDAYQQTALSLACVKHYYDMALFLLAVRGEDFYDSQLLKAFSVLCDNSDAKSGLQSRLLQVAFQVLDRIKYIDNRVICEFLKDIPGDYNQKRMFAIPIIHKLIDGANTPYGVMDVIEKLDELRADLSYLFQRRSKMPVLHYRYRNQEVTPKWLQIIEYAQNKILGILKMENRYFDGISTKVIDFLKISTRLKYGIFSSGENIVYGEYEILKKQYDKLNSYNYFDSLLSPSSSVSSLSLSLYS